MTVARYFSRARLRRDASVGALLPLLGLGARGRQAGPIRPGASHALVWSLFADHPDRERDFLYRETEDGTLYILSSRPPDDRHVLFDLDSKPWRLELETSDRLSFALRANPVIRRKIEGRKHSTKDDVVMRALYRSTSELPRREQRSGLIPAEGQAWLERVAARTGFAVIPRRLAVDGYRQHIVHRVEGQRPIRFATLDFEGLLEVTDPDRFAATVAAGFGACRAYGCGLMLLRRA